MSNEARENFEVWAVHYGLQVSRFMEDGSYTSGETRKAWNAWQALSAEVKGRCKSMSINFHSVTTDSMPERPEVTKDLERRFEAQELAKVHE
jgi:hypothetical protein